MGILNESAVADARTTFETLANSALNSTAAPTWQALARRVDPNGSIAHETIIPGATPTWKQMLGQRVYETFRVYTRRTPLAKYDKYLRLPRESVVYDQTGSTAAALSAFTADLDQFLDKFAIEKLAENPTGADNVALVHDSHPFASGGGTWDNKTTDALSFASFNTERARMRALLKENGEPIGLEPKILLVHPDEEELAIQIAQADSKPVSVGTAGAINSGGIGGSSILNVFRGSVDVVVSARWTSGDWVIIDPRFPPLVVPVWRDPEVVIVDDMTSHQRVENDLFVYGVEADAAFDGLQPWGIAGKIT